MIDLTQRKPVVSNADYAVRIPGLIDDLQVAASLPVPPYGSKGNAAWSGLTWAYFGGQRSINGVLTTVADNTLLLTASVTNYVEYTDAGTVSANSSGFSTDKNPIAEITTTGSAITAVLDRRSQRDPVTGRLSKSVAGNTDITLTAAEARNEILEFTGALTGSINVILPARSKPWIVSNGTSGAFSLTVKTAAGTGKQVTQGYHAVLYGDGTNINSAFDDAAGLGVLGINFDSRTVTLAGTDNYTGTASPAIAAYPQAIWTFKFPNANTSTTVNVNLNSIGNRRVKDRDGNDPAVGDIKAGAWHVAKDDGTNFILMTLAAGATAGGLAGVTGLISTPLDSAQGTWTNGTTTYAAQAAPTNYNLFSVTNNDGHIVTFTNKPNGAVYVDYLVTQAQTGAPVFTCEFWDGAAWTAGTINTTPDFTKVGYTQLKVTPGTWATGGSGTGVPAGSFNMRHRATTAPTQAVQGRSNQAQVRKIVASEALLADGSGNKIRFANVSVINEIAVSQAASAAGQRDQAAAFSSSSWIYEYLISDGTNIAALTSASQSAPTLPSGYTYKLLLGGRRLDSNVALRPVKQVGKRVQYTSAAYQGIITGVQGSVAATPTLVAGAVGAFVPPTAVEIGILAYTEGTVGGIIAPNPFQGGLSNSTNPSTHWNWGSGNNGSYPFWMVLESTNIYYACNGAANGAFAFGWVEG